MRVDKIKIQNYKIFQDSMFFVNYMKQGGHWLIVGDTFGIGAFYDAT